MADEPAHRPGAIQRGSIDKAKKMKPFGIFDFAWRRVPLILAVGIPLFILFSLPVPFLASPVYEVGGKLLITPTKIPSIDGRDRESIQGDVGWFSRTLALRFTNPSILRRAIRNVPEENRPNFLQGLGDSDRAVFRLMTRLEVAEVPRTYMIEVNMEGASATGLAEILNAVFDAFIDKLQEEQERQYTSQMSYLKGEREKIRERVETETTGLMDIAGELDSFNFLNEGYNGHFQKQSLLEDLYWTAKGVAMERQATLEQAKSDQEDISQLSVKPFADEEVANFLGINQMEQWTYTQTQALRTTIDGLTEDNTDRKNVENRMAAMLDYLKVYKDKVAKDTLDTLDAKRKYELEEAVIRARNSYTSAEKAADEVKAAMDEAIRESNKISQAMFRASKFSYGVQLYRDRLASINARIDQAALQAKAPLPVLIDQRALPPAKASSTNASKLQMMAFMGAFGVIAGLCLVFDFFDPRIRTRAELGAAIGGLGCEPIGEAMTKGHEDPEFPNILTTQAHSHQAAVIRDIAVRLLAEQRGTGARVIDVVGSHPRSGNTALALLLARALANHGLRILVAELPTEKPALATMVGMESLPSGAWASKTQDPMSAADIVPWVEGTEEDAIRASLNTFLKSTTSGYDFVLLDSQSPLDSDLAHGAMLLSDVALITAKQDVALFGKTRKIVEWAANGGVPAITAVLNFAAPDPMERQAIELLQNVMGLLSKTHSLIHGFGVRFVINPARAIFKKKDKKTKNTKPPEDPGQDTK